MVSSCTDKGKEPLHQTSFLKVFYRIYVKARNPSLCFPRIKMSDVFFCQAIRPIRFLPSESPLSSHSGGNEPLWLRHCREAAAAAFLSSRAEGMLQSSVPRRGLTKTRISRISVPASCPEFPPGFLQKRALPGHQPSLASRAEPPPSAPLARSAVAVRLFLAPAPALGARWPGRRGLAPSSPEERCPSLLSSGRAVPWILPFVPRRHGSSSEPPGRSPAAPLPSPAGPPAVKPGARAACGWEPPLGHGVGSGGVALASPLFTAGRSAGPPRAPTPCPSPSPRPRPAAPPSRLRLRRHPQAAPMRPHVAHVRRAGQSGPGARARPMGAPEGCGGGLDTGSVHRVTRRPALPCPALPTPPGGTGGMQGSALKAEGGEDEPAGWSRPWGGLQSGGKLQFPERWLGPRSQPGLHPC